jgi:hypothetical protein
MFVGGNKNIIQNKRESFIYNKISWLLDSSQVIMHRTIYIYIFIFLRWSNGIRTCLC